MLLPLHDTVVSNAYTSDMHDLSIMGKTKTTTTKNIMITLISLLKHDAKKLAPSTYFVHPKKVRICVCKVCFGLEYVKYSYSFFV